MKFKLFFALLVLFSGSSRLLHSADVDPPVVISITPTPGPLFDLTQIMVQFSEPVRFVGANDLLINGVAAASVSTNGNTYTFRFPRPNLTGGGVHVAWAPVHGITDLAGNMFAGASVSWDYYLIDITPPVVREIQPAPGSTVRPLREVRVTFSEAVTNVDAGDLLLNGRPAQNVIAQSASVYLFQFNPASPGKPKLAWATGHGITDLALTPNAFAGGGLIGSYFVDATPYSILVNSTDNLARVIFSNRFFNGVCTIENREGTRWVPLQNFFATQRVGQVTVKLPTNDYAQLRLRCLEVNGMKFTAFTHLAQAYGNIHTIAGTGVPPPGTNTWLPEYEGAFATNVYLNNPRYAVADASNNVYVVERDGHAVDQITPDGRIHTFFGTHRSGKGSGELAVSNALSFPTGLWLGGTHLWILDAGNSRVRAFDFGTKTVFSISPFFDPSGIGTNGAGLWVSEDSSGAVIEVLYGAGTELRRWTAANPVVTVLASGFQEVGNVIVDPLGRTIVCDPKDDRVYRVRGNGSKQVVAGSGFPSGPFPRHLLYGGAVDKVALPGARSVWYLPIGGYFIGLDQGAQVWYVDSVDNAVPFIFGEPGIHEGDGLWFREGGPRQPKIGNIISVTVAPSGDIILVEAGGFVRKIDFLRHLP